MTAIRVAAASLVLLALERTAGVACPSCYGAQDSPMTAGMNTAILVMLGIIGGVLMSFVAFIFYLWRRNRRVPGAVSNGAFVSPTGVLITKNEEGVAEWNSI